MGRVHVDDVAGHEPVEQHADGSQVLLDRGRGEMALQILHEGGDVEGLYVGEAGSEKLLASEPCGVFRRQKDSDRGDVARLADAGVCAMAVFSKSDPMTPPLWVPCRLVLILVVRPS